MLGPLFNCCNCGYHPQVIMKRWLKGFEEQAIIEMLFVHPEGTNSKEELILDSNNQKISTDGEYTEEAICAKCGKIGRMEKVPKAYLISLGFDLDKNICETKSKKTSLYNLITNAYKNILNYFNEKSQLKMSADTHLKPFVKWVGGK